MRTTYGIERSLFWILVAGFMLTGLLSTAQGAERVVGRFETPKLKISYLVFLPEDYGADSGRKWPLIFLLHGAGSRGDNVDLLNQVVAKLPQGTMEQFIYVLPQCPAGRTWVELILEGLDAFLNEVMAEYAIDANRLYLVGLSMGGDGAWFLAITYPERFAAIAPLGAGCCFGDTGKVCVLKNVPVWVFHGAKDTIINPIRSEVMVEALKACGGNVKFTLYPDAGHVDGITRAVQTPELYEWLLQHSLQPVVNVQTSGKRMATWGEIKQ